MPTSYTSLLGLALPVTGELAGTWGDTVNDYISKYVDSSVAGTQTISGSQTAVTLTRANGASLSQAGSGATGSSQYQVINCTGNPAGTLTVTIDVTTGSPTLSNSTYSQTFAVINATSTSQSVVVRATTTSGTSTGTTLVSGEKALIAWNGSDFIKVATSTVDGVSTIAFGTTGLTPSAATSGAVTVAGTLVAANGGTGQSSYTTGDLLYATGSTALSKLGIGTNGQILTSTGTAPQWSAPAALTKTDDTNVTLTLGGSASTALLNAASITAGWTGQLSVARGGTNATATPTAGAVAYGTGTAYAFTAAGTSNQVLISNGASAPSWSNLSSLGVTSLSFGTTGLTPSTATQGAITVAGTLATTNGGTGLTSFTANGVVYASSSSALTTGSALTFDGSSSLVVSTSASNGVVAVVGPSSGTNNGAQFQIINGASITSAIGTYSRIIGGAYNESLAFYNNGNDFVWYSGSERMRLTSTGLGIGTSSPATKLQVANSTAVNTYATVSNSVATAYYGVDASGNAYCWNGGAYSLLFGTGGTQRMTLDSSGNLGLGVTPSAWQSATIRPIEINRIGNFVGGNGSAAAVYLGANTRFESASWRYANNGAAGLYTVEDNTHFWRIAASGTAGNAISFTQAMTLDASGNLFVGYTGYPTGFSTGTVVLKQSSVNAYGVLSFASSGSTQCIYIGHDGTNGYIGTTYGSGSSYTPLVFQTSDTERARISSDGTFRVKGAGTAGSTDAVQFAGSAPASSLTLDASGNLGVGTTSPTDTFSFSRALDVNGSSGAFVYVRNNGSSTNVGGIGYSGSDLFISNKAAGNIRFFCNTDATERARITSVGNLSLGGTADRGTTVGTNAIQIFNGTAPAGTLTNGVSLYSSSGDLNFMNSSGNGFKVGYRNLPAVGTQTGSYTLATGDVGKYVQVGSGGSITIPDATFAEGDAVSIFNNTTGNITITCSITTAYIAGTDSDKATMTLATRGVATILFISSTVCVVTGNVT